MDEENGKGTGMLGLVQLGLLSFFPRSRRLTAQHSHSPPFLILPSFSSFRSLRVRFAHVTPFRR